jgi:hypothetical protein
LKILLLILDGRHVIAEAVPSLRIVEHLDIVEDILPCLIAGAISLPPNSFSLEQLEKALGDGVIMAVPAPAHALLQIVLVQEVAPIVTAELTALDALLSVKWRFV